MTATASTKSATEFEFLTPEQAADLLQIKPATLAVWRCTGRYSLPFMRVGRSIRYRRSDLLQFAERNTIAAAG